MVSRIQSSCSERREEEEGSGREREARQSEAALTPKAINTHFRAKVEVEQAIQFTVLLCFRCELIRTVIRKFDVTTCLFSKKQLTDREDPY